jgi:hypothetical protein
MSRHEYESSEAPAELGDTETLLEQLSEMIAGAPNVPLSSTPRVDRGELLAYVDDALRCLPEEIKQARFMLRERDSFIERAQREADEIIEAARVQAERMVQRTDVMRAAEQRARQVLDAAESDARRVKMDTEDYLDRRLASFEILLDRITRTVAHGRQRLGLQPIEPAAEADTEADEEEIDPSGGSSFFDQERFDDPR